MADASPDASPGASVRALPARWRALALAATVLAWIVLALVVAGAFWRWFGPSPAIPPLPPGADDPVRKIVDARLFGGGPATVAAAAQATTDARLLGIFASRTGTSYALFRLADGPVLAVVGEEFAPGMRLDSVENDRIAITDQGSRREIVLRGGAPLVAAPKTNSGLASAADAKAASCRPPAGFKGAVYRLNAELLGGMMNSPTTWKSLVQAGPGALVVRDQSGFAGMLGLKNGDRVERANGIALVLPEDIATAVLRPLTRNLPVLVAGTRGGQAQQWLYLNAGSCRG